MIKISEKIDKYLNFTREPRNIWNMEVKVIPIAVCALGTVLKRQKKGLEESEIESIKITALL